MKTKHYHNTNGLDPITARLEAKKNLRQEDIIYTIFKDSCFKRLTASEVWEYYKVAKNIPLTSIRRGMSNLQKEGILEKTKTTRIGIYGKPEHFYKLSQLKFNEEKNTTEAQERIR